MDQELNNELIKTLIAETEPFWEAFPSGLMRRHIEEYGFHEENGLRVTWADIPLGQYYVALSVLARDMHLYLIEHPRDDAGIFHEVVSMTQAAEAALYQDQAFPGYGGYLPQDQVAALPTGLALVAEQGHPTLAPLRNPQLVHEWTFKPGKRLYLNFLQRFGAGFKDAVCDEDEPTTESIVAKCLLYGFSSHALVWYPIAVCLASTLMAELKSFCRPD